MKPKKDRFFYRFWREEKGLSSMLLLLAVMHFVLIPLLGSYSFFRVLLNVFWMLFLAAGIFSLQTSERKAFWISYIPFLFIVFGWINVFSSNTVVSIVDFALTVGTFVLVIILILIKVFEPGPVTKYKIIGSIVVYMILSNLWSVIYLFLFQEIEGSFAISRQSFKISSQQADFLYFSYITITSTGFGDIIPLHPLARSLVQAETVVGVLYPVILIGNLVSGAGVKKKDRDSA